MGLRDLTTESILEAVEEFDRIGRAAFLSRYGFGEAHAYYLVIADRRYDSKAVAGAAHGYARPDLGALRNEDFSGGAATVASRFADLGFEVEHAPPSDSLLWHLAPGDKVKRTELHDRYGGSRQGGISPSRTTPNVLLFTDRSVGEHHGYLDRWEGTTLHYTGEGQQGDQQMTHGNKAIRDHVDDGRTLRVFEGSSGHVTYVGEFGLDPVQLWYTQRAPASGGGPMRDVIMFRLTPLGDFQSEGRHLEPEEISPQLRADYVPVPEDVQTYGPEVYAVDPEVADRGRKGHRVTQNALAEWIREHGLDPIRPVAGDPPFDVGWWSGETFYVAEVKSLTSRNEIHQLRMGLGQVLDYVYQLRSSGIDTVPVLAVEVRPFNESWTAVCGSYGVVLVWPETLDRLLDG